jgi:two-component system NarL family sensor kinase
MDLRSLFLFAVILLAGSGTTAANTFVFQQPAAHANDSIFYFVENGQSGKARKLIGLSLNSVASPKEKAQTYLMQGDLEDSEGYSLTALEAYRKCISQATKASDKATMASALRGIASVYTGLALYDSVLLYVSKSLALDASGLNRIMNDLVSARYWQVRNQHDKSLTFFQQANDKAGELKLNKYRAQALAGMSSIYFYQEPDMRKTLQLLHESVALCDSIKQANLLARNYGRIANANMVLGNGKEAERYLNRAKRITDISGNLPVRGYILSSLSIFKAGEGDIKGAIQYAEEPIRIKRTLGQLRQLQNDLLNLSELHMELKDYKKAAESIREGLQTSASLKDVVYMQYFYERSSRLDSLTGNFPRAYSNLKKAMAYKDSVIELQRVTAVEELREKYETEQREKTITEKELVIQQQKYQQFMIIGGAALVLLVLIVLIVVIRTRHRMRLALEMRKHDQLRLQTIVHTQEEVQQSIARDIHDGLVQVLGAAKVSLEAIQGQGDKNSILDRVKNASRIMDEACLEARSISHQLLPYSLLKDGLPAALDELFRKSLPHYSFEKNGEPLKMNSDTAINIYRIAQEAVNNILKHAEASEVNVELSFSSENLFFVIHDNGKGFIPVVSGSGAGLMNMHTRAEMIHGTLQIQSQHEKGTRIQFTVPL